MKKIDFTGGIRSWEGLVEKVDVIGCCTNIGQLIAPIVQPQCRECAILPKDQFLMAAHMWCLNELSRRAGSSVSRLQDGGCALGGGMVWHTKTSLWAQCRAEDHPPIWADPSVRKQFIQQIDLKQKHREKEKAQTVTTPGQPAVDGAVVFGDYIPTSTNWMKKMSLTTLKSDRSQSVALTPRANGSIEH